MKINIQKIRKVILPITVGAVIGYAYWYFIGCNTGTCPITSNPYTTTGYGALIGTIWSLPGKNKKTTDDAENN